MKFHRTIIGFILGVSVAFMIAACAQKSSGSFSASQVEQIQNIVHNYLVTNPQVLIEASQALQKKELAKVETAAHTAIAANASALFQSKTAPVAGNAHGKVTLIEFFDYQCPHCVYMAPIVAGLVKQNSDLRVVSMDFPIFGAVSEYAARAALAAGMQGKYWEMHNALFAASAKERLNSRIIDKVAQSVGLNLKTLKADMNKPAVTAQLAAVRTLAQKMKLSGTPAFIVGPSNYTSGGNAAKVSFFPGQSSVAQLQQFIDKAK